MKANILLQALAALALIMTPRAKAQNSEPAHSGEKNPTDSQTKIENRNITLTYEAFSLPIAKAGEILRLQLAEGTLYGKLVASGKLERLLALPTKSGQRTNLENVTQYIYPTEFTPPRIGEKTGEKNIQLPLPITATAFTQAEIGDRMEYDPMLFDAKIIRIGFSMEHTALVKKEKWGQGMAELEQPQIESQKVTTAFSATIGAPRFIGTLNPPFGNGVAEHAEQRVWFCFITPTINEVKPVAPKNDKR